MYVSRTLMTLTRPKPSGVAHMCVRWWDGTIVVCELPNYSPFFLFPLVSPQMVANPACQHHLVPPTLLACTRPRVTWATPFVTGKITCTHPQVAWTTPLVTCRHHIQMTGLWWEISHDNRHAFVLVQFEQHTWYLPPVNGDYFQRNHWVRVEVMM